MRITVNDIIGAMNIIAPSDLAESWDNVGLQVGDPKWTVRRIWMALDPLPEVIQEAAKQKIDLIITHHPLLFDSFSSLNLSNPEAKVIADAIQKKIAIYSAHTNLDKVSNGINDILAQILGLQDTKPIISDMTDIVKLVIFVPQSHADKLLSTLFEKKAGNIDKYSKCSFLTEGVGTFQPELTSNPYLGKIGKFERVNECKVETVISLKDLPLAINEAKKNHPYETMAYDVYPLKNTSADSGIGRVGNLKNPIKLKDLADIIIKKLDISYVRIIGDHQLNVSRMAICSGSGGSLLKNALTKDVQAYVTGDLKYHDARKIESYKKGAIDVGHFDTEHIFIDYIVPKLQDIIDKKKWPVKVLPCPIEKNPFQLIINKKHLKNEQ